MKKMAKSKFEEKSPEVLQHLSDGHTIKEATEKAGIGEETFYGWVRENSEFSEMVNNARKDGEKKAIADVEASLLDLAKGFEYEEVRTEYESKLNPATEKYEPTIKKQVRTKKRVIASTEAIKFYLTNKAPEIWKNRLDQNTTGNVVSDININYVSKNPDDAVFPSSEDQVDAER